jgi:hypothetical protein
MIIYVSGDEDSEEPHILTGDDAPSYRRGVMIITLATAEWAINRLKKLAARRWREFSAR